jgi:hypothetical protein
MAYKVASDEPCASGNQNVPLHDFPTCILFKQYFSSVRSGPAAESTALRQTKLSIFNDYPPNCHK